MRRRLEPAARRSQLIETAIEQLEAIRGRDLVVDDVADAAGVSRALVYRYFSGIDELMVHARRRFFAPLDARVDQILREKRTPERHVRASITAILEFAVQRPHAFCAFVEGGSAHDDPPVWARSLVRNHHRGDASVAAHAIGALLAAGIAAWLRNGLGSEDPPADLLFDLIWTGLAPVDAPQAHEPMTASASDDGARSPVVAPTVVSASRR